MPQIITTVFQGCGTSIKDLHGPDGKINGKSFVIVDPEVNKVYEIPMDIPTCRAHGQKLMGIGDVEIVNGRGGLGAEIRKGRK